MRLEPTGGETFARAARGLDLDQAKHREFLSTVGAEPRRAENTDAEDFLAAIGLTTHRAPKPQGRRIFE